MSAITLVACTTPPPLRPSHLYLLPSRSQTTFRPSLGPIPLIEYISIHQRRHPMSRPVAPRCREFCENCARNYYIRRSILRLYFLSFYFVKYRYNRHTRLGRDTSTPLRGLEERFCTLQISNFEITYRKFGSDIRDKFRRRGQILRSDRKVSPWISLLLGSTDRPNHRARKVKGQKKFAPVSRFAFYGANESNHRAC